MSLLRQRCSLPVFVVTIILAVTVGSSVRYLFSVSAPGRRLAQEHRERQQIDLLVRLRGAREQRHQQQQQPHESQNGSAKRYRGGYPWQAVDEFVFERRSIPVREQDELEQESGRLRNRSWQRRKLCEPYTPRLPPGGIDGDWPACRRATDLLAVEFASPSPLDRSGPAEGKPKRSHSEADAEACREREARVARDIGVGVSRENPKLLKNIALLKREFEKEKRWLSRRKGRSMRDHLPDRRNSSDATRQPQQKKSKNLIISVSLIGQPHVPPSRSARDERRVFLYSFMTHAVPGRDFMIFVADNHVLWRDQVQHISRAVSLERNLLLRNSSSSSSESNGSSVEEVVGALGVKNSLSAFAPLFPSANETLRRRASLDPHSAFTFSEEVQARIRRTSLENPTIFIPPFVHLVSPAWFADYMPPGGDAATASNVRIWYTEAISRKLLSQEAEEGHQDGNESAFGSIVVCDSRDIVFFANPFDALASTERVLQLSRSQSVSPWIVVVAEDYRILEHDLNFWWMSHAFVGEKTGARALIYDLESSSSLSERRHLPRTDPNGAPLPVLCSGILAGQNLEALLLFTMAFRTVLSSTLRAISEHGIDQGALMATVIALPSLVDISNLYRVFVLDPLFTSFARHSMRHEEWLSWREAGSTRAMKAATRGTHHHDRWSRHGYTADVGFVNCAHEKYSIFHQYDRKPDFLHRMKISIRDRIRAALDKLGLKPPSHSTTTSSDRSRARDAFEPDSERRLPRIRPGAETDASFQIAAIIARFEDNVWRD